MDAEKSPFTSESLTITHDGYFREAFRIKQIAQAFVKKLFPKETLDELDLDGLTVDDRSWTDEMFKETIADVVYRIPIKRRKESMNFFVVLEHKSYQDFLTIFQLWCYVYQICRREFLAAQERGEVKAGYQLPPVVAVILYHGKSKFKGQTELAELFMPIPGLESYRPRLQAILFDLNSIVDDDPILDNPEVPELKVVLMVLKTVFRSDVTLKVNEVLEKLKPYSDDPAMRRVIRITLVYLANNARHLRRNFDTLFGTFQKITGEKVMPTMVEIWKAEGIAIGEARGKVLAILQVQFGKVPHEIESTVRSMMDIIALESLVEHAKTCKSLDKFAEAIR